MHFTPLIRNLALQHAATACVSEICLLCELGFLFDMLQKADGSICQATNLLRTLSSHPQGRPHVTRCANYAICANHYQPDRLASSKRTPTARL